MSYRMLVNQRLSAFRDWTNSRDSRRFRMVMLLLLAIGLTLIIGSNYLPHRYRSEVGNRSPNAVVVQQAVTFENRTVTEESPGELAEPVEPVYRWNPTVTVLKGERVVAAGEVITPLAPLPPKVVGAVGEGTPWKIWTATFIVVLLELLVLAALMTRFSHEVLEDNVIVLLLTTLFLLFTGITRIMEIAPLSPYLVPAAALGMLATIILDPRTALLIVTLGAVNVGMMFGFDFGFTLVALAGGMFAIYPASRLGQRTELAYAGLASGVVTGVAVIAAELFREAPTFDALRAGLWGLANGGLTLVLTATLLMVFEWVFNLTTPLRLLELANPAQPLLRRMMQVAPGTYNHSISMGNLAESAAEAVGADPLLARVGAYYHDVGKVTRPEYFIENQLHVRNPHDKLNPNLSKLAITAHVDDGVELGKQYGLPQPIIDIIRQHHGTSLVSYFYQKAKESANGAVPEETYRYESDKPTSPEAAIIMLADSVEAAAKAMKNPTVKKMQGLIHEIFKQKMDDGQLDESRLTLDDLHRIREVFENSLRGLAAHRVPYPGERGAKGAGGAGTPRAPRVGLGETRLKALPLREPVPGGPVPPAHGSEHPEGHA